MKYQNKLLLFDLGGVIINLDTNLTITAFAEIAKKSEEEIYHGWKECEEFKAFERGELSNESFRSFLRDWLKKPKISDALLDHVWNAMILDLPKSRLDYLLTLKGKYTVVLLSNTNDIHLQCVNERALQSTGNNSLDPYFDKCFYSHLIGMRKPDAEIYNFILQQYNVKPAEVLFLDDNIENIAGAAQVGIQALHVGQPDLIFNVEQYV